MDQFTFLAFDLGATSGRSVVGTLKAGKLEMRELTRFPNAILEIHGKFYWNIFSLYSSLKEGLLACVREGIRPDSIGVDTWGVDFACLAKDGSILGLPRAYRDPYTDGKPEEFFKIIPKEEVYNLTGIQIMNFNSLYQLYAGMQESSEPLKQAAEILFMPDALSYLLTGKKVCEYTIASTSQILNPRTKKFETSLLKAAGVHPDILQQPIMPGTLIGTLTDHLAEETGIGKVPVIAVAGHDTASAVAAVPAQSKNFAYLSSGTWSLMGIETEEPIITKESYEMNFTNEGGIGGTTRFLKNICGMWILEQCRKEWEKDGKHYSYPEIVAMAESATPFYTFINTDHPCFANPPAMLEAIRSFCLKTNQSVPDSDAQIIRCIFESLALRYRSVIEMLEQVAPFPIEVLHVIGGGSKNNLLNQFTANAIGKPVITGPSEGTAIGNILIQAMAVNAVTSLSEMREIVRASIETEKFLPKDSQEWLNAYQQFRNIL